MSNESEQIAESQIKTNHIFKPATWLAKIDLINHLILQNNVLFAVVAEKKGGKTTFVNLLQSGLDREIHSLLLSLDASNSDSALLAQIAEAVQLSYAPLSSLTSLVAQINAQKNHFLVIIDNAELLSESFLQEILQLVKIQSEVNFFHICLVSDFSLINNLNKIDSDVYTKLIHTIEPGALSENETRTYLLSNLPSPKRLDQTMSDKRLDEFYDLTAGNIAHINKHMNDFFVPISLQPTYKPRKMNKYLSIVISLIVVICGVGYWQFNKQSMSIAPKSHSLPLIKPVKSFTASPKEMETPNIVEVPPEILVSQIPAFYVAATHLSVQPSPLKKIYELPQDPDDENYNDQLVVMDKVVVIPKNLKNSEIAASKDESEKLSSSVSVSELPRVPRESNKAQNANPAINQLSKKANNKQSGFTIQILASHDLAYLHQFINSHHLQQAKLARTTNQGIEWYVVTLGDYQQLAQAETAKKQLPLKLAKFKPWVRPIAALKPLN